MIVEERVVTTVPKAKAVKPLVDKMITLGKRDTLHARRQAAAFLETPGAVKKLFDKLGSRFGQRSGGYTRIVRLGWRKGDGAEQCMLELVGSELVKRAAEAGVLAYLVKPFKPSDLPPAIEVARKCHDRFLQVNKELADAQERLESRKLLDRAKGILMETEGVTEAEAYRRIQLQSMNSRKSMKEVAEAVILAKSL